MRASVGQKFQANINICNICHGSFDRQSHAPIIVCFMHHTVCKACTEALRANPQCPFCREPIRMDKLVINNYIFDLLHGNEPAPNVSTRSDRDQPMPQNMQYRPYQPSMQGYSEFPRAQNQYMGIPPRENQLLERPAQNFNINSTTQNDIFYMFVAVMIQIPFTVMNLFMGYGDYGSCTEKKYENQVHSAYRIVGIAECVLIGAAILGFLLYKVTCLSKQNLNSWFTLVGLGGAIKIIFWALAEWMLFKDTIYQFCSQLAYGYSLFLAIIHVIIIIAVFIVGCTKSQFQGASSGGNMNLNNLF